MGGLIRLDIQYSATFFFMAQFMYLVLIHLEFHVSVDKEFLN
jgi:hypothetical protein